MMRRPAGPGAPSVGTVIRSDSTRRVATGMIRLSESSDYPRTDLFDKYIKLELQPFKKNIYSKYLYRLPKL